MRKYERVSLIALSLILFVILVLTLSNKKVPDAAVTKPNPTPIATESAVTPSPEVAIEQDPSVPGSRIRIDQVGYLPDAPKIGMIIGDSMDVFEVFNVNTNQAALTGKLSAAVEDVNSGDSVRSADFSAVDKPGTYILRVAGAGDSYPFTIGDNVYYNSLVDAARSYTLARSGVAMDDPVTGLKHAASHTQDAKATMFFSDGYHKKGDILDVSGGWYDAGDYGKYIPTAAVSTAQLLLAYEMNPDKFTAGQMSIPQGLSAKEKANKLPDLLTEVKYELDWMRKLQRQDGAVYLKVSGALWTGVLLPESDTQDRYVYGLSTYGTAQYAATMAMASRVYQSFDPVYAQQLLKSALKSQAYLEKHPDPEFRKDEEQDAGSGPYTKITDAEERYWAAAELLKTTGEPRFDSYIQAELADQLAKKPVAISWSNAIMLGDWAYYTSEQADAQKKEAVKTAVIGYADDLLKLTYTDGYRTALQADDYIWASVKEDISRGQVLLFANEMNPKPEYVNAALDQLHYLFGRNATGYSYMTGSGTKMPLMPHHRIAASTETYLPGLVVGGPNKNGGDPTIDSILKEAKRPIPPAKAYVDITDSYATNEYAIDYTAPVLFVLAYFSK
ncbi:MAG: glycoside hydrolase family 9 protein [Paenibacillaceae bacterium]